MTEKHQLSRDAGPSGWTELSKIRFEITGWELFVGDPESPHMCRGWFRCEDPDFTAKKNTEVRLYLVTRDGDQRILDATIVHVSSSEPLWDFRAVR